MKMSTYCKKKGVELKDCGNGHYQIKGKILVNWYPESKGSTAYIAGTKASIKHVDGAESWSWADIKNNSAVSVPSVNPHNETLDRQ